jgi:hypothetical protein
MFLNKNIKFFLGLFLFIVLGLFICIYLLNDNIFTRIPIQSNYYPQQNISLSGYNASELRDIQNFITVYNIHYDINNINDFSYINNLPSSELFQGKVNGRYLNFFRVNNTILTVHPNVINEHIDIVQTFEEFYAIATGH